MNKSKLIREAYFAYEGDVHKAPAARIAAMARAIAAQKGIDGASISAKFVGTVKGNMIRRVGRPLTKAKIREFDKYAAINPTSKWRNKEQSSNGVVSTPNQLQTKDTLDFKKAVEILTSSKGDEITLTSLLKAKEYAQAVGGYERAMDLLTSAKEYLR